MTVWCFNHIFCWFFIILLTYTITIIPFSAVINAGVAGCCTGIALSFPGNYISLIHSFNNCCQEVYPYYPPTTSSPAQPNPHPFLPQ